MSDKVSHLKPAFSGKVVQILTNLLAKAHRGEIDQVALICLQKGEGHPYGVYISERPEGRSMLEIIGGIADLQYTALQAHNEGQCHD